jgi:outer membrane receptor protein involved in Fe transport
MRTAKAKAKAHTPTRTAQPDDGGEATPPADAPAPADATPAAGAPAPAAGTTDEELARMAAEAEAAAANSDGTVGGEVIEVTGSLVDRKTLDTPAPVSVVDREIMQASGLANVGDILQKLPSQSNAINVNFNNGGDGSTRINLRGLGAGRTLVLMNGRRVVPGGLGADASVDLNVIPLAAIDRVEVLKDGASAIYGSDAIGGVVNVITRQDFKGTEAQLYTGGAQASGSKHGMDGQQYDASIVTGTSSAKGNIMLAAGYSQTRPIFAGDRAFARSQLSYDYTYDPTMDPDHLGPVSQNGSSATPEGRLKWKDGDPTPGNALWDSLMTSCPSGTCYHDPTTGAYRNFNSGGNSDTGTGDLYNFQPENYLVTPLRRYNVFADGTYHFSDHVNGKFELLYTNRKSNQSLAPEPLFFDQIGPISGASIYNPFGRDVNIYRRRLVEGGDRLFKQNIDSFRTVVGLEGDIPEDAPVLKNWKWEVSYNYGRTSGSNVNSGSLILSHLTNAVGPSFIDPATGAATCGTIDSPGPSDCVPVNILGTAGSVSRAALKYLQYTGISQGFNDQKTLLAQTHGQLAKTPWGGDIALGLGADYRREQGGYQPDPLTSTGDSTGNATQPTLGGYNVGEAFAELSIVPVTNRKLAKYVEIDGAVRGFNYSTFGSGATWKIGALYKIPQGVSIRGTYSTAFRSPNIGDLFSGQSDNFAAVTDPCDKDKHPMPDPITAQNCAADGIAVDHTDGSSQLKSKVGGNPNLQPEKAKVLTAGIVIEPEKVKGLSLTLDYFHANITNAITSLGESVILAQCYSNSTTNRENCNLIHRNATSQNIDLITNIETNVGGNVVSGMDYAAAYDHDFGKVGRFRFNVEGTVQFKYNLITATGTLFGLGVYDLGVFPRIKNNVSVIWGKGNLGAGTNMRFIGGYKECQDDNCATASDGTKALSRKVDSNITNDLFVNYSWKNLVGKTAISAGVNNVFDKKPPFVYAGFLANSDASTYDYMGRFVYVRLGQTF